MSAECRRLRGQDDTGPECTCRPGTCALNMPERTQATSFEAQAPVRTLQEQADAMADAWVELWHASASNDGSQVRLLAGPLPKAMGLTDSEYAGWVEKSGPWHDPGQPLCAFYAFPEEGEPSPAGPNTVLGCPNLAAPGPKHFFWPTPGGALRVPVCEEHLEWLQRCSEELLREEERPLVVVEGDSPVVPPDGCLENGRVTVLQYIQPDGQQAVMTGIRGDLSISNFVGLLQMAAFDLLFKDRRSREDA